MNPNGPTGGEARLDRLERLFAVYAERNEAAHEAFEDEHKKLLTAQVLMTQAMEKVELKLAEATDKLNALITIVDEDHRRPKN